MCTGLEPVAAAAVAGGAAAAPAVATGLTAAEIAAIAGTGMSAASFIKNMTQKPPQEPLQQGQIDIGGQRQVSLLPPAQPVQVIDPLRNMKALRNPFYNQSY